MTSTKKNPPQGSGTSNYVILAALSFDETGDWALREAARIADGDGHTELHVVHVVLEDGPADSSGELLSLDKRLSRAPDEIKKRVEEAWRRTPRKVIGHLRAGTPAKSILQTAVDIDADIIVVGSHQRGGIEKLILGSVAERVLRDAHCPVLVALPKDYRGKSKSQSIEPPCPACVTARRESNKEQFWCERHSRAYGQPHIYEPSDRAPNSVMPTH